MYQLRNLINRRNVTNDPSYNVDPSEDFFLTVVEAYIVNAAMDLFQMKTISDDPVYHNIFSNIANATSNDKQEALLQACNKVVTQYVDISFRRKESESDGVYSYTCEIISLGLLLLEFNDGIHEGDGDQILQCWKLFFPINKATKR